MRYVNVEEEDGNIEAMRAAVPACLKPYIESGVQVRYNDEGVYAVLFPTMACGMIERKGVAVRFDFGWDSDDEPNIALLHEGRDGVSVDLTITEQGDGE